MWKFWIDTGGTFTDCLATDPNGRELRAKVLSSSRVRARVTENVSDCQLRLSGVEGVCDGFFTGYRFKVYTDEVESAGESDVSNDRTSVAAERIVKGWDAASGIVSFEEALAEDLTGALCEFVSPEEPPVLAVRILTGKRLEDPLPPMEMRLATTRGTNALLERKGAKVAFLVTDGFADLLQIGDQRRPKLFELGIQKMEPLHERAFEVKGRLDAQGRELEALDEAGVRAFAKASAKAGVEAFAVALLHGYRNPLHESRVAAILREEGARFVSISSELAAFAKMLPRAETAVVDAYLSPIMDTYLDAVEGSMAGRGDRASGQPDRPRSVAALRVMTSAGGLVSRVNYRAKDSLLSGPAGGVVGASRAGLQAGFAKTIAFDMGGTSTDVSRFEGQMDYRFEQRIGAARVFAPSLRIETVAAGGGSVCWFDGTALRVGPQSAGADPGPACYGAGGPLAMTDVNVLLGRLEVSKFGIPVFPEDSKARLAELQEAVFRATGKRVDDREMLEGLLAIANETMAEAIRKISTSQGYDPSEYALVAFGGAGGLHACGIAEILGMDTIVFPSDAGLLSADGLRRAQVEQFAERQVLLPLRECIDELNGWVEALRARALERLRADGIDEAEAEPREARYELRFIGQDSVLVLEGGKASELSERFETAYFEQFGFLPDDLEIELVAVRVVMRNRIGPVEEETFYKASSETLPFDSRFVSRADLHPGASFGGPAVIQDAFSTVYLDTDWFVSVGSRGSLRLERKVSEERAGMRRMNQVVELELFTNRFLSLVDEMGALLKRAAFSTNVRERMDFSCALLDADGYLVANAPHIPVHLGAMGVCVREVLKRMELLPGDVVMTNHPAFGGSHLPDVTLIAPVYAKDGDRLLGYVANRAHHAEIGGISPGSMPPHAKNLAEEGVVIAPLKVVKAGVVDWNPVRELLEGGRWPSRSLGENFADLAAQLAAVRKGQNDLRALAEKEGADRVSRYMGRLKERAALALREALIKSHERASGVAGRLCREKSDSGAEVCVTVTPLANGKWMIDFAGTSDAQSDNYNATPAIAISATMYVLRLLAGIDLPLNEGFLDVVDLRIPEGMLNPKFEADPERCPAVVAGNVEVSQLVVSALLKAFGLAACSQSTMNNFIFGTKRFGYYETIAGGEGATALHDGASGVHTHMTNTAATDPEIMELRYPVRVERFGLRRGSGGGGVRRGGDGVVKRIRFLESVTFSLLSQRRKEPPFGMEGGGVGAVGEQWLETSGGERKRLSGNGSWELEAGSVVEILTPGGGGWGREGNVNV